MSTAKKILAQVPWKYVIASAVGAGLQAAGVPKQIVDIVTPFFGY